MSRGRQPERCVILLDVGESMGRRMCYGSETRLAHAVRGLAWLVRDKLRNASRDEVSLVLFGGQATDNPLASELGGYAHVRVVRTLQAVDESLISALDSFSVRCGDGPGDVLDALAVGADVLYRRSSSSGEAPARVLLVTDAGSRVHTDDRFADHLRLIIGGIVHLGAKLHVLGVDFAAPAAAATGSDSAEPVKAENEELWHNIVASAGSSCVQLTPLRAVYALMDALRSKTTQEVSRFRGDLDLGSGVVRALLHSVREPRR